MLAFACPLGRLESALHFLLIFKGLNDHCNDSESTGPETRGRETNRREWSVKTGETLAKNFSFPASRELTRVTPIHGHHANFYC